MNKNAVRILKAVAIAWLAWIPIGLCAQTIPTGSTR